MAFLFETKSAALARLKVGDVITRINGDAPMRTAFGTFAGKTINVTVERSGAESEMPMKVGSRDVTGYNLVEMSGATPQQKRIRDGWLKG